jgi:hypothetical protein
MLAALQLTNLLYVVAAIVVATFISTLIALRHRRPKSLESGIESFSRELRALAPEREAADGQAAPSFPRATGVAVRARRSGGARDGGRRPQGEHYRSNQRSRASDDGQPIVGPGAENEVSASLAPPGAPESAGLRDPAESTGMEGQAG